MNTRTGRWKKPSGKGPVWIVAYRQVNNVDVEILQVTPYGTRPEREPGKRFIMVHGQDELAALQEAINELAWLRL